MEDRPDDIPSANGLRPGRRVDNFELLRCIGEGGMAEVWLARDLELGRRVALKVLRSDALAVGEEQGRMLAEARAIAHFAHPSIVTIHAVGVVDGRPYLALEYLDGDDLRTRLRDGPLPSREALRVGLAVAEALEASHRAGILHRDLKPENVVLCRDGRLRVVDFGLARTVPRPPDAADAEPAPTPGRNDHASTSSSQDTHLRGTPGYMSPEQWLGLPVGPPADCWAFGVLLFELVTGTRPWGHCDGWREADDICSDRPAPSLPALQDEPAGLSSLIAGCLAKDHSHRPDAAALVEALRVLQGRSAVGDERGPFRGLSAFDESLASLFFGRESELGAFLERLRRVPVLPVVGPSGAGKSSFVKAGVIPRLRERGAFELVALRPGRAPLESLADQVLAAGRATTPFGVTEGAPDLARRLLRTPGLLAVELGRLARGRRASVLLFVDQLEEVLTQGVEPDHRRAFLAAVAGAADDPLGPVRTVFTVREEFLGRLAEEPGMARALQHITVLRTPGPDVLRDIITRTIHAFHHDFDDPSIPDEMVSQIDDAAAGLPLLQFAGELLWQRRDRAGRLLRRADFDAIGGVAGALARHADGVVSTLGEAEQRVARVLLLRLVTGEGTRRRLSTDELLEGLAEPAPALLDRLVDARLLAIEEGQVELAHESLVGSWRRLARWVEESREDLAFLSDAWQAAQVWERRGRPADEVWTGLALDDALRRVDHLQTVPLHVRRFLEAGRKRRAHLARRKRTLGAAAFGGLALAATVFGWQRQIAVEQRAEALAQQASSLRALARAAIERGEGQQARATLRAALELGDNLDARASWWRSTNIPLEWSTQVGNTKPALAWSPDGRTIAVGEAGRGPVTLYDASTRTPRQTLTAPEPSTVGELRFSEDGTELWAWLAGGLPMMTVWTLADGSARRLLQPDARAKPVPVQGAFTAYEGGVGSGRGFLRADTGQRLGDRWAAWVGIAEGGAEVLVRRSEGNAVLRDIETSRVLVDRELSDTNCAPKGMVAHKAMFVCKPHSVDIVDSDSGELRTITDPTGSGVHSAALSPDGTRVAVVSSDSGVVVWKTEDGSRVQEIPTTDDRDVTVAWTPDGQQLLMGGAGGVLRTWDLPTGALVGTQELTSARIAAVSVSPAGDHVAVTDTAGSAFVLDLGRWLPHRQDRGHEQAVYGVAFSPTGEMMATSGVDEAVQLWDTRTGESLGALAIEGSGASGLAFSPDGLWLATSERSDRVRIWDLATRQLRLTIERGVRFVAFSPDSTRLAAADDGHGIRVWSVPGGEELSLLTVPDVPDPLFEVAWSPNGLHLAATAGAPWAAVWDVETGALLHDWWDPLSFGWWRPAYRPDGRLVIDLQQGLMVCRPGSWNCEQMTPHDWEEGWWSSAGTRSVFAQIRDELHIWRPGSRQSLLAELPAHPWKWATVDPTERWAAVPSSDGYTTLARLSNGRPAWATRAVLTSPTRVLSQRGWQSGPGNGEPYPSRWRTAVETEARLAAAGDRGPLCITTWSGAVEMWDVATDRRLATWASSRPSEVRAHPDGCLVRTADGVLMLLDTAGQPARLATDVVAFGVRGDDVLVASTDEVWVVGGATRSLAPARVSAVGSCGDDDSICIGLIDGGLRLLGQDTAMQATPSAEVVAVTACPAGTVVAGYANGTVGIWDPDTGARLLGARLHGPARHIVVEGGVLMAATDLGDVEWLDLSVLEQDHCALMAEIWQSVPAVPGPHGLVLAPPPADHPCRD